MFKKYYVNFLTLLSFLLIFTIFCFSSPIVANAQALDIPNANFNSYTGFAGSSTKFKPTEWTASSASYYVYSRSDTAVEGYGVSVSSGNTVDFITNDYVAVSGGDKYSFCFNAKSDGEGGTALLTVTTYDSSKGQLSVHAGQEVTLTSSEWLDVTCDFTAEDDASYVKITITIKAADYKCYFDNLTASKTVVTPELTTMTGASLRLVKDSPGIRFRGRVEKGAYDRFLDKYESVSTGIMVTLKESLDSVGEFTAQALDAADKVYVQIEAQKWSNEQSAAEEGYYEFYCAIVNVKPQNVTRDFAFITYFTYVDNGVTYTVYGNYNAVDNVRSVYSLASVAYANIDEYGEEQQEIITYYVTQAQ